MGYQCGQMDWRANQLRNYTIIYTRENMNLSATLDDHINELVEELNQAPKPKKPALIAAIVAAALVQAKNEVEE